LTALVSGLEVALFLSLLWTTLKLHLDLPLHRLSLQNVANSIRNR